ncbi:MAG TPA: hypothetical protein VGH10_00060 [Actinomycetota bacterium]|jgi:hypothetical protein
MDVGEQREKRIARNEAIAREINEGLEQGRSATGLIRMVCECGDAGCERLIAISLEEYEHVRSDPTHFAVLLPHVEGNVERVIEATDRFVIVEKIAPAAAEIAIEEDPRGSDGARR